MDAGVPVAAALAFPDLQVISVNGDFADGLSTMEVDTTVRHGAKAVFTVSNIAIRRIKRFHQQDNRGGRVMGTKLRHSEDARTGAPLAPMAHASNAPRICPRKRALVNAPAVVNSVTP